jgi:hypothetical protein
MWMLARDSIKRANASSGSLIKEEGGATTITFRINTSILNVLRQESEAKETSLNSLLNQLLKHYVEWDTFERRIGMIPFPKNVISAIFAEMTEEQITRLATSVGKDTAIDMAIFMQGRIDMLKFVSWMEMRMKNSGSEVVHRLREKDDMTVTHTLIIKHDMGKKWSLYLKMLIESIISEVFKARTFDFILTDAMLSLRFEAKKNFQEIKE